MTKKTLTPAQRREYQDVLDAGIPEAVVLEFIQALDSAETRWREELRDAVRTARPAIIRGNDA